MRRAEPGVATPEGVDLPEPHLARARARARVRARARATARVKVKVRFGGGGGAAVRGARDQLVRHRAREVHQGALLAGGRVGIRGVRGRGLGLRLSIRGLGLGLGG